MVMLTGCSDAMADNQTENEILKDNPFDINRDNNESQTVVSYEAFGPVESLSTEGPITFDYEGGELALDYFLDNKNNKPLEYGFFLFLDGIPQPFKTNEPNAKYEFLHVLNLDANEYKEFQIIFTPTHGKAGDTRYINVGGMFNPSFIPDLEKPVYGFNHYISSNISYKLTFHKSTDYTGKEEVSKEKMLRNIRYSEEEITTDMRKKYEQDEKNQLDELITIELYEEGNYEQYNNNRILADGKESVKLIFRGFGREGVTYRTTFYLNHQPIGMEGHNYLEWHTIKGSIAEFKMDLDVSKLEGANTLYSISVPIESDDIIYKTESILLTAKNK